MTLAALFGKGARHMFTVAQAKIWHLWQIIVSIFWFVFGFPLHVVLQIRELGYRIARRIRVRFQVYYTEVSSAIVNSQFWKETVIYPPVSSPKLDNSNTKDALLKETEELNVLRRDSTVSYKKGTTPQVATFSLHLEKLHWGDDLVPTSNSTLRTYITIRHLDCFEAKSSVHSGQIHEWDGDYQVTVPIHDITSDITLLFFAVNRVQSDTLLGFVTIPLVSLHSVAEEGSADAQPSVHKTVEIFPASSVEKASTKYRQALRDTDGVQKPRNPLGWISFESRLVLHTDSVWEAYCASKQSSVSGTRKDNIQHILLSFLRLKAAIIRIGGRNNPLRRGLRGIRSWRAPWLTMAFLFLYFHLCFTASPPHVPFVIAAMVGLTGWVDSHDLRRDYNPWRRAQHAGPGSAPSSAAPPPLSVQDVVGRYLREPGTLSALRVPAAQLGGLLAAPGALLSVALLRLERLPLFSALVPLVRRVPLLRRVLPTARDQHAPGPRRSNLKRGKSRAKKNVRFRLDLGPEQGVREVLPGGAEEAGQLTLIQQALRTKQQLDSVEGYMSLTASRLEQALNLWNGSDPVVTSAAYAVLLLVACVASLCVVAVQLLFAHVVAPGTLCFTVGTTFLFAGMHEEIPEELQSKAFGSGSHVQYGHELRSRPSFLYLFGIAFEAFLEALGIQTGSSNLEKMRNTLSRCPDESERAHREIFRSLEKKEDTDY